MPGNAMAPALAESWAESADGLSDEFTLRQGLTFHNGDAFTAEDVKFSFERYKAANATLFLEKAQKRNVDDGLLTGHQGLTGNCWLTI